MFGSFLSHDSFIHFRPKLGFVGTILASFLFVPFLIIGMKDMIVWTQRVPFVWETVRTFSFGMNQCESINQLINLDRRPFTAGTTVKSEYVCVHPILQYNNTLHITQITIYNHRQNKMTNNVGTVLYCNSEEEYYNAIESAGSRLVVGDCFAEWWVVLCCSP